jgi:hypothetical protein
MAYMSQEKKSKIAPVVKGILKKYGMKGSLSVDNHSTLCLNIASGPIQFSEDGQPIDVNPYWYHEHYSGKALKFLKEVFAAMNDGNHDRSDSMTDYFDVGWYVRVNIGKWNKPYVKI